MALNRILQDVNATIGIRFRSYSTVYFLDVGGDLLPLSLFDLLLQSPKTGVCRILGDELLTQSERGIRIIRCEQLSRLFESVEQDLIFAADLIVKIPVLHRPGTRVRSLAAQFRQAL